MIRSPLSLTKRSGIGLIALSIACDSTSSEDLGPAGELDSASVGEGLDTGLAEDEDDSELDDEDTDIDVDEDEDEDEDEGTEDQNEGPAAYSGDLEIVLYTTFGEDDCFGRADLEIDDAWQVSGDGTCSFTILGSQTPIFEGELSDTGSANGTVDLVAFGEGFQLEWLGTWTEIELVVDYSGTTTLDSIGDVDYEIRFELEAEIEDETTTDPTDADYVDYSSSGSQTASIDLGTFTSTDGCEMEYALYTPNGDSADTLVVLQHGFARSPDQFTDWGSHLASWGLPTLIMSLCHSSALDINLDQNAADVVELVDSLHDGPVLYMGHSNGAISSIIAASLDDDTVAVLGLDAVERFGGDHTDDAAALDVPVYGIFGESGVCNAWNSGLSAYESTGDRALVRVTEADHCDFEGPTNTTCTVACSGSNDRFDDDQIQGTIVGLSTAFLTWQALGDSSGQDWWSTTGSARVALEDDSAITGL